MYMMYDNEVYCCSFRAAPQVAAIPNEVQIKQQLMALASSPYSDSPLFWNLKPVRTVFDICTNMQTFLGNSTYISYGSQF